MKNLSSDNKRAGLPARYGYAEHKIADAQIDERSFNIIKKLKKAGYEGYIVGGAIRDILLGRAPKDFDVVTNASPEQIKRVFPRAIIIGRRFKLVHILSGSHAIEVSTFRASKITLLQYLKAILSLRSDRYFRENLYGDMQQDVERRDITINALYYDPLKREIIDYKGGYQDIKNRTIVIVGDPYKKFVEDPMRMLRIVRFAAKLNLQIPQDNVAALQRAKKKISKLPGPRMFDECTKFFFAGHAYESYRLLAKYELLGSIFSYDWAKISAADARMIEETLKNTDERYEKEQNLAMVFLLSVFLWPEYQRVMAEIKSKLPSKRFQSLHRRTCEQIIAQQKLGMGIPIRFFWRIDKIWGLQRQLNFTNRPHPERLVENRNLKLAYDLLAARALGDEKLKVQCDFWREYAEQSAEYFKHRRDDGDGRRTRRGGRRGGRRRRKSSS